MDERASDNVDDRLARRLAALRRVMVRLLDAAAEVAREDASFRDDLTLLLGGRASAEPHEQEAPTAEATATKPAAHEPAEPPAPVPASHAPASAKPAPAPPTPARPPIDWIAPRIVETEAARYPRQWLAEPFEPARVAQRCRLKAEACRWQSERSRLLDDGRDVSDGDREMVARARAADVYLWMVSPAKWRERSEEAFELVAGCYDALADAAELMGLAERLGRSQEAAMKLLAEAQSGLRAAVEDYAGTRRDDDQESAFGWLRRETDERRVFVEYMQLEHPAPPDNFAELRRRIAAVRGELEQLRGRDKSVRDAVKKIAWHAEKLTHLPPGQRGDGTVGDFVRIAQAVEEVLAMGLPPSDVTLREALLPALDRMPDDEQVPAALSRVLDAIDDYLDRRDTESADAELAQAADAGDAEEDADALVGEARRLVAGRRAILIGGRPSEPHRRRIERGLGLASLEWVRVEHHQSFDDAAAAIRRADIGLVMIMTRWRSHRDGPAARLLCKQLGIPLVELPSGYNLRQVAHQLVSQVPATTPDAA